MHNNLTAWLRETAERLLSKVSVRRRHWSYRYRYPQPRKATFKPHFSHYTLLNGPIMTTPELRRQVINIYKGMINVSLGLAKLTVVLLSAELLNVGRQYPLGYEYFRDRLHKAFSSQAHLKDEEQIRNGIARAEFVKKGTFSFLQIGPIGSVLLIWWLIICRSWDIVSLLRFAN